MRLVFATNNLHKLQEVRQILPTTYVFLSLQDVGFTEEIEETGKTLEENSMLKAQTVWRWLHKHGEGEETGVFADDTGLEVKALGGEPGVYSARYAGEPCDSQKNRQKLLQALTSATNREARFRTVVTLILPQGETKQVEGIVDGMIAKEEHGEGGFGYDSLFSPKGYEQTFAELTAEEKNKISHRGRAMQELKTLLNEL